MDRFELLERLCVAHRAPVPDDVVSAGPTLVFIYNNAAAGELALGIAESEGLPVIHEISKLGGRCGAFELAFHVCDE